MAENPKFEPLAGNAYIIKFLWDNPPYKTGTKDSGEKWFMFKLDVWENIKAFQDQQSPITMVWFPKHEKIVRAIEAHKPIKYEEARLHVAEQAGTRKDGKKYTYKTFLFTFKRNGQPVKYFSEDYLDSSAPGQKQAPGQPGNAATAFSIDDIVGNMGYFLSAAIKLYEERFSDQEYKMEDIRATATTMFIQADKKNLKAPKPEPEKPAEVAENKESAGPDPDPSVQNEGAEYPPREADPPSEEEYNDPKYNQPVDDDDLPF
jgi:hypothetical protein